MTTVRLFWDEAERDEVLQLYDVQPDGRGRLDWAAVEKAFLADTVKIKGRGQPGVFPNGDKVGLTRDLFQPNSVITVIVSLRSQGANKAGEDTKGGQSIAYYLEHKYKAVYKAARPDELGYRGRFPAKLRSRDEKLKHSVALRDGKIERLELGAQFDIICRQNMVEAALYYFARIEDAWMGGSGDTSFARSTALMSLVGAPGCGKTTALLDLLPRLRAYIKDHPDLALKLVQAAASSTPPEQHKAILERLRISVQEGRELVCWLRLNKDPVVRDMEKEGDPENRLALRVLYGFLTYLDNLDEMSPAGTYAEFLAGMDSDVRKRLFPGDVYEFVERMTGLKGAQHCFFLLLDEFNAVIPEAEGKKATWAQELMSTHVNWLSGQPRGPRLVVPVLGTTRHTDASLSGTASQQAKTAVLPLSTPLLSDMQRLAHSMLCRSSPVAVQRKPEWHETSALTLLLGLVGGNFRLLHYAMSLLGGAPDFEHPAKWSAETLASRLADSHSRTWAGELGHILTQLSQYMTHSGWLTRIDAASEPQKRAVITQAIAHALAGECVQLDDKVEGSGGIKWGTLMNEGLIIALFAGDDATSAEEQHYTSVNLSPRAGDPGSPADLEVVILKQGPSAASDAEEATTPPAKGSSSVQQTSPILRTATPIGYRKSISPSRDPAKMNVTVQLCPMVMSLVWSRLHLPMLAPVAQLYSEESWERKEKVDLASLLIPLLLRRRFLQHLGKELLSLKTILRCSWLHPCLAGVKVILPPESRALGAIGHTSRQFRKELFAKAVAAGHEALELTAEDGDNSAHDKAEAARLEVESDKVAYAFKGASNYGVDTFLTLQTAQPDGHVLILLQSKQSSSTSTHTLEHALQQMDQDLMRSGISVQGRQHVEALECPPEAEGASKAGKADCKTPATRGARHSHSVGGFPGGSMEEFVEAAKQASKATLDHWADQLAKRNLSLPESSKLDHVVYMFVTDLRMMTDQHVRHRVLALAGHRLASRLVLVDQDQHDSFYGVANALARSLPKAAKR